MTFEYETARRNFLRTSAAGLLAGPALLQSLANAAPPAAVEKKLIYRGKVPANAEPELADLVKSWLTPLEHFYVRSHAPVPRINLKAFRLRVEGLVEKPLDISLEELSGRFPQTEVIATLTCAGNRRSEHSQTKLIKGVQWAEGAIGNAKWGGVSLANVLKMAGVKPEAKHVWFEGLDKIEKKTGTIGFGASIPMVKAMSDTKSMTGAMLCTRMNGQALLPDHGFPLRTVVPGYIGARSVKWLGRIVVSNRPSPNHYVAHAYKLLPEDQELLWSETAPIYPYVLNSVICTPKAGTSLNGNTVQVSGYALAPGRAGRTIDRVEVSADGGNTWRLAKLTSAARAYCWQLWSVDMPVTATTRQFVVRAVDSAGTSQPQTVRWNVKGYLYNAWHRVPVK